jgi:hypothetical protein
VIEAAEALHLLGVDLRGAHEAHVGLERRQAFPGAFTVGELDHCHGQFGSARIPSRPGR